MNTKVAIYTWLASQKELTGSINLNCSRYTNSLATKETVDIFITDIKE